MPLCLCLCLGNELNAKDSFEFLIHDMRHMEHFVAPDRYPEQVRFFRCMLNIHQGALRRYFTGTLYPGDSQLWHALEYVISDM